MTARRVANASRAIPTPASMRPTSIVPKTPRSAPVMSPTSRDGARSVPFSACPMLPSLLKITIDAATRFAEALARREPDREKIVATVLVDQIRELI